MKVTITCAYCGAGKMYERSHVNRQIKRGAQMYCSRTCAQAYKRTTDEQKREYRIRYGRTYREKHKEKASAYAKDYYWKNRQEQIASAQNWYSDHKEHVSQRGRLWRARRFFGPFAEAYLVWLELDREIAARIPNKYERLRARGCYACYNESKKERRRREHAYRESAP